MIIIAQDGSGDFTTIQAAIDAIPEGGLTGRVGSSDGYGVNGDGRAPTILLVRMGEYHERVVVNKDNVRIVGEARDRTVITHSACAKDLNPDGTERKTFLSFTLLVTGRNVEVDNLTIRNDAGDGRQVGQAVAVYAAGDRGVWRNCRMIAHQDTLFCGPVMPKVEADVAPRFSRAECVEFVGDCPPTHSRQYFEDCYIEGDVDFIFGPYRCWFERCTLFMGARGGWYTAANTPREQDHGMVFHKCRLTGACPAGEGYLGRPWRGFARTLFMECDMDEHVSPLGFVDWDDVKVITDRCGEWRTTGARADQTTRHPRQKRLTDAEAAAVNLPAVLSGCDGWRPDRPTPTWYLCGDSTMANYGPESAPMTGWGQALQALLPENVFVENCAMCGRSSKSFIAEKRLGYIELCLRPCDTLLIQFSHNDEKGDALIATDARGTFPEYLNMYIDAARRTGAEPVLITPIARRRFDDDGALVATHGEYPDAARQLAVRRGVRLIDMEAATSALLRDAGVEGSKAFYCHVPAGHPNYPDGSADNSHLSRYGAIRFAQEYLKMAGEGICQ